MLNTRQRWILFVLFCLVTLALAGLECFLVVSIVRNGFDNVSAVSAVLNAGFLAGCGFVFLELVRRNFLKPSITSDRLQRFVSERCNLVEYAHSSGQGEYETRQHLVRNSLRFAEECLRGWVPGSHFELCVFVDQDQPLLFAYFDSNHQIAARSMSEREGNPHLYVERRYEVTKLLGNPTSHPRILLDTHDSQLDYVFTSDQQRTQLRSSVLICLDVATPCALVVSSNEKKAFSETDVEVVSFIRYIGALVRYDLFEAGFIQRVRQLRPGLFAAAPAANM